MPVHGLIEVTAQAGQLEAIHEATLTFLEDVRGKEPNTDRAEAFTIEGTRTVLIHLVFADALAAEDHRAKPHTERFTREIEDLTKELHVHELEPVTRGKDVA